MRYDRASLAEVAERIASAENRYAKLQLRVQRLKDEGSDTFQDEETLLLVGSNLRRLYDQQSAMRRSNWVIAA